MNKSGLFNRDMLFTPSQSPFSKLTILRKALFSFNRFLKKKKAAMQTSMQPAPISMSRNKCCVSSLKFLSVYCNRTSACKQSVRSNTTYLSISGGNHSEFGDYGHQSKDGDATISPKNQEKQIAAAVSNFII